MIFVHQKKAGFTLIELMVVLTIIGLLATVLLAAMKDARETARDARRTSDLKQLQIALEQFRNQNGGLYPCAVPTGVAPNNATDLVVNMTTAIADAPAGCADITKFMSVIVTDPTRVGATGYGYLPSANRTSYTLRMIKERNNVAAVYCGVKMGTGSGNATWDAYTKCY